MRSFKLGVMADCFRLPAKDGVRKAAELGAEGVQVYTVAGEMSPEEMDDAARRDFKSLCDDLGLAISALCGDMGGGLRKAEENPQKVERSKRIVDLAVDLGSSVVTTHVGVVPEDRGDPAYQAMLAASGEIAEYARQAGVAFAIETGPEKAETLKQLLDEVDSEGLGVNLDPANLIMVVGDDPVQAVHTLKGRIVHTHAKDGVQLQPCDALEVYTAFDTGGFAELEQRMGTLFEELPLGQGAVDWDAYLDALAEVGFDGFLTVEREVGEDPATDIARALEFLREKID